MATKVISVLDSNDCAELKTETGFEFVSENSRTKLAIFQNTTSGAMFGTSFPFQAFSNGKKVLITQARVSCAVDVAKPVTE